jgi:hypothetical protein
VSEANKAKILKFHQDYLKDHSEEVVRKVVQLRFPGYARGGSASGRLAAAAEKKAADTAAGRQSITSGKPIYVAMKPKNLQREDAVINGRQYTPSDFSTLEITGKGYLKTPSGWKYISWRK